MLLGFLPLLEKQAVIASSSLFSLVIAINLVTIAVLAVPGWRARPDKFSRQWLDVVLIGLIASGLVVLLNIKALETTSATHRSIFQAMYPAATAVFAYKLLRERLPVRTYGIIAAMVLGIVLMSIRGLSLELATGDMLLVVTLPLMGFCDAWVKKSLGGLTPAWVALCRFTVGTVFLVILGMASGIPIGLPERNAWPWILLSGLCIGGGILLLYKGMALRGASLAAAMIGVSPVITLVLEWLLFDVTFTDLELLGMAVVVSGGLLLTRPRFQGQNPALYESQNPGNTGSKRNTGSRQGLGSE